MARLELGAIQFDAEYKGGELVYGSPRIEVLQDNSKEIAPRVPDGKYRWILVLDLDTATKFSNKLTIGEVVERGWIECPKCQSRLLVNSQGDVTQCSACGDEAFAHWNLFVQTLP